MEKGGGIIEHSMTVSLLSAKRSFHFDNEKRKSFRFLLLLLQHHFFVVHVHVHLMQLKKETF